MLGIKKGTVLLCDHEVAWEIEAKETIARLKAILGDVAKEIQHVGSTAIPSIKAKPIVDLAVAVDRFEDVLALEVPLREAGFYYRPNSKGLRDQILFACGSNYDGTGDLQTHFIHVVLKNSMEWKNYINFRNYLNANPRAAKEYEDLKIALFEQAPEDPGREKYTAGKHDFVTRTLRDALIYSYETMPPQADDTFKHYDLLIDEGNDPVCDPPQLQKYMDQWDGEAFFDMLHLSPNDTVLELGVGTGRLALKIAPKCKDFCGIDVS
ncbi:MAG: GrpB family protein, partial [Clostridia bacterium]|nr:GrpB family protein [Clostridia bacterium]